jgi:acetolactate synthase-1/3 small subunit
MYPSYSIELTVRDRPGVLVRVAHVFARRGCNIRSIIVKPKANSGWSTMTIQAQNVERISQMMAQLNKLIDVENATTKDLGDSPVHE